MTTPTDWLATAPCKDDPDAMFPGTLDTDIEQAKAVCRRCSAVDRCLAWALDTGEEHGVWGGLSEGERRQLKQRAARAINLDDYTGTREPRQKAVTLQEAWNSYTEPHGDHLLWTGPKVMNRPGTRKQVTANRLAFYLDRGRWPEGDTKRTCTVEGCVKPAHLEDRVERSRQGLHVDLFRAAFDANTATVPGGHHVWTSAEKKSVQGRTYTPNQIAFIADRGREPEGLVRTGCSHSKCVLAAHLSDAVERGAVLELAS